MAKIGPPKLLNPDQRTEALIHLKRCLPDDWSVVCAFAQPRVGYGRKDVLVRAIVAESSNEFLMRHLRRESMLLEVARVAKTERVAFELDYLVDVSHLDWVFEIGPGPLVEPLVLHQGIDDFLRERTRGLNRSFEEVAAKVTAVDLSLRTPTSSQSEGMPAVTALKHGVGEAILAGLIARSLLAGVPLDRAPEEAKNLFLQYHQGTGRPFLEEGNETFKADGFDYRSIPRRLVVEEFDGSPTAIEPLAKRECNDKLFRDMLLRALPDLTPNYDMVVRSDEVFVHNGPPRKVTPSLREPSVALINQALLDFSESKRPLVKQLHAEFRL